MNFTIDRNILLENLNIITRGLPSKTPMPHLTGIKLDIIDGDLYILSSNTDIAIQTIITKENIDIKENGSVLVPGIVFIEIVKKINSEKINVNLIEDKILIIKTDRSEFKLRVMDVFDYPSIDFVCLENPLLIQSSTLTSLIKETSFATAQTERRPIFTGVNSTCNGSEIKAIATDSYRLSQKKITLDETYSEFNIVIPNKSLNELLRIVENLNEVINVYFSNNKVLFKFKNILFQTRLLDGNYPDTSRIIPQDFPVIIKFNRNDLLETLDRVSLLSPKDKENNYNIIVLTLKKDKTVEISTTNLEIGDAIETITPCEDVEGPMIKVAFSSKYLTDAVRVLNSDKVNIKFTGETKPFIIDSDEEANVLHLILPVRSSY